MTSRCINLAAGLRIFPVALLLLVSASARAAAETTAAAPVSLSGSSSVLQMLLGLFMVIAIIIGLSLAVKKFNMFPTGAPGAIKIISGLALSNKDRILLLQVGDEQILVSASPGQVRKVHELRTPVAVETNQASDEAKNFANILNAVKQRVKS
ncbi:MAG: flagellar biosynthetic protein FliO [Gammaproteobacteria bacterium]